MIAAGLRIVFSRIFFTLATDIYHFDDETACMYDC